MESWRRSNRVWMVFGSSGQGSRQREAKQKYRASGSIPGRSNNLRYNSRVRAWLIAVSIAVAVPAAAQDLDRDGLPDRLEQQLLDKFTPTLLLTRGECDGIGREVLHGGRDHSCTPEQG